MSAKGKTQKDSQSERSTTNECIAKCIRHLSNLTIEDDLHEFPVKFVMDDNIRRIELKNIVDPRLQDLDPQPDIQILFKEYDQRYFGGALNYNNVEIVWGQRLFVTAGQAVKGPQTRIPIRIEMSRKLLTFCKRKYKVETLLHEMIHSYLLINNLEEYESHGPLFIKLMHKLNELSGANITVCHSLPACVDTIYDKYRKEYRKLRKSRKQHLLSLGINN